MNWPSFGNGQLDNQSHERTSRQLIGVDWDGQSLDLVQADCPEEMLFAHPRLTGVGSTVWTRLIMPNGRSIMLERLQDADAGGYSGLEDEVENHWKELLGAAALSTILGVGAEPGSGADTGSNTDIIQARRLSAANSLNQTGQQVVRRNLNIQPTLTIGPGFPLRVIVNRALVLEP
jgi:type IV secretory pathway VirB10-like protein